MRERTTKAEEDLRVGRPHIFPVGCLSWDHFGLGMTMTHEAPLALKREDGIVADDCSHTGELCVFRANTMPYSSVSPGIGRIGQKGNFIREEKFLRERIVPTQESQRTLPRLEGDK